MATSLQNLADRLSVSVATVSRCLNDHPDSSLQTRRRVKEMADKLGYVPDSRGRPRRQSSDHASTPSGKAKAKASKASTRPGREAASDRTFQLGVIVQGAGGGATMPSVTSRILDGLSRQARSAGVSLLIHQVSAEEVAEFHRPQIQPVALAKGELDGLVLLGKLTPRFTSGVAGRLPCVSIAEKVPGVSIDCIDHDDADSVSQLVERLVSAGHRRIGFVSEPRMRSVYASRYAGLVQSLIQRGLPVEAESAINIYQGGHELEAMSQRMADRIADGVTGWIAVHDMVGYHVMDALQARGLTAPEHYALAGFDDLAPPHRGLKKLVSIEAPFEAMGEAAVRLLLRRIGEPLTDARHSLFRCSLVEGQTIAEPSDAAQLPSLGLASEEPEDD